MKFTEQEIKTLLMIKSLLNCLRYFINTKDLKYVDDFHKFCRKHCSWGVNKK